MLWADSQWYFSRCHGYFSINRWPFIASHPFLIMPSRKSRDFSHGMDRLTQRPFGHFFFWSALYFRKRTPETTKSLVKKLGSFLWQPGNVKGIGN